MEKSEPGSGLFQWIVGGLLAVIAVLAGAIYNDMRGSIKEAVDGLSTFKIEVVKQLGDIKTDIAAFKGEMTKQLGDLKAEIGATNSRLDQVVDRLDRLRTR